MRKLLILCMLFTNLLVACNKIDNNQNQNDPVVPYGIKPIIYYHTKLYGIAEDVEKLPENYVDSGDIILASEKDPSTIPSKECYTSNFNSNNVGASIFINLNNDDTIYINVNDRFVAFRLEKEENY